MLLGLSRFLSFLAAAQYFTPQCVCCSPADGHLVYSEVSALTSKASVNMPVQGSVCKCVSFLLGTCRVVDYKPGAYLTF